ncbi:hypothetical protein PR048_026283 [Dryococelus australis]|uniref:Cytochrome P450 n=1 Tax=Dryococelus australis TaxID=614101 RepID=A0ABQ9GKX5_9NEOP|nr:hypothetical protein PR048_026283 [Dryococelus australis]
MRVTEVSMEQRRNEEAGETEDPRENPPTNGIVRQDSHMIKFVSRTCGVRSSQRGSASTLEKIAYDEKSQERAPTETISRIALFCLRYKVAFLISWARFLTGRYYRMLSSIPGPKGVTVFVNMLLSIRHTSRIIDFFFKRLWKEYGRVFAIWAGPQALVVLSDPQDIKVVLNKKETLAKPGPYRTLALFLGYSLFTATRHDWQRHRRAMNPSFSTDILETFLPEFDKKSKLLVGLISKHNNGEAFDVLRYMMMCTLDTVSETVLGTSMSVMEKDRVDLVDSLNVAKDLGFFMMLRPWWWVPRVVRNTPTYKKMASSTQVLWDFAEEIVTRKLKRDELVAADHGQSSGFLDHVMVRGRAEPGMLTMDEVRANTMINIVAGMDTSSITLCAALMLLALHQDVQRTAVKELQDIFDDDPHRQVTSADLKRMEYLEQVINETLRLYPPGPLIAREVEEDVSFTGYTLPAGTIVVIPIYLVHRDPKYYHDPEKFDPARFSPENTSSRHPYSFIPFSGGRRSCIAKKYAYMQMKTVLSCVLRNYCILPCSTREEIENVQFKVTLHLINGFKIKAYLFSGRARLRQRTLSPIGCCMLGKGPYWLSAGCHALIGKLCSDVSLDSGAILLARAAGAHGLSFQKRWQMKRQHGDFYAFRTQKQGSDTGDIKTHAWRLIALRRMACFVGALYYAT